MLANRAPLALGFCDLDNRQNTASSDSPSERMPLGNDGQGNSAGRHEVARGALPSALPERPHARPVSEPPSRWRAHTARQRAVNEIASQSSYATKPHQPDPSHICAQ